MKSSVSEAYRDKNPSLFLYYVCLILQNFDLEYFIPDNTLKMWTSDVTNFKSHFGIIQVIFISAFISGILTETLKMKNFVRILELIHERAFFFIPSSRQKILVNKFFSISHYIYIFLISHFDISQPVFFYISIYQYWHEKIGYFLYRKIFLLILLFCAVNHKMFVQYFILNFR